MKTSLLHITFLCFLLLLIPVTSLLSQNNKLKTPDKTIWAVKNPFEQKVFIENKGQFDNQLQDPVAKVVYGASCQGVQLFFTAKGLTYKYAKRVTANETEPNKIEKLIGRIGFGKKNKAEKTESEEEERHSKIIPQYLTIEWADANKDVIITAENQVSQYYTYAWKCSKDKKTCIKALAFKKIIYKNLYPNIDLEYIIPQDSIGVEYSFVVHPGGDIGRIQMKYNGEEAIGINNHSLEIKSSFGLFTDHAPIAYYAGSNEKINSSFKINNKNTVGFALNMLSEKGSQISSRTIIIDPWTAIPTMMWQNKGFDVNYDASGNVYVGGGTQLVAKYSSTGTLIWVYSLPSTYYTDFAINGLTSEIYMFDFSTYTQIDTYKIDASGTQTGFGTAPIGQLEAWRAEFDPCNNQIIVASGSAAGGAQAFVVDQTNLSNVVTKDVLNEPDRCHDMALLAIDDDGTACYMLSTHSACGNSALHDNEIVKCPLPNLVPSLLSINSGFTFSEVFYLTPSYTDPAPPLSGNSNGFNGMKVKGCYLYGYDGSTIKIWDKHTGTLIQSITVGGTPFLSGGLDVDECGNIYAGNGSTIKVYNASYSLSSTITVNGTIYDLRLGPNNKLYASGDGFVQEIDLTGNVIQLNATLVDAACNGCNGSANAQLVCNNIATPSSCIKYLWSTGDTTQVINNLCAGIYTVTVHSSGCGGTVYVDTLHILSGIPPVVTASPDATICAGAGAPLTASGALTYKWTPGGSLNDSTIANPIASPAVTTTYIVSGYNAAGCENRDTVTVFISPPLIISAAGAVLLCSGDSTMLTASAANGNGGPYTYSWAPAGSLNNPAIYNPKASPSVTTTYTVTANDGCSLPVSDTVTVSISQKAVVSAGPDQTICSGNTVTLAGSIGGSTSSGTWSGGAGTFNPNNAAANAVYTPSAAEASAGTVTLIFTTDNPAGPCPAVNDAMTITINQIATANAGSGHYVCSGAGIVLAGSVGGSASGGTWSGGTGTYSPNNAALNAVYTPSAAEYTADSVLLTLTTNDPAGPCSPSSSNVTFHFYPKPIVNFSADDKTGCPILCTNFADSSAVTGGDIITSWNWNFGDGTQEVVSQNPYHCFPLSGFYDITLTAVSNHGCSASLTKIHFINVYAVPHAAFNPTPNPATVLDPTITFINQSSADVNYWHWNFGDGITLSPNTASPVHEYPKEITGSYLVTLIVHNADGCYDTIAHTIVIDPEFAFFIPNSFTPNGDGINDYFFGSGVGITGYDLWIFDRWGNMIFHGNELLDKWDGRANYGRDLAQIDVYVWKVELTDVFNKKHSYIGTVTLVK